jgi:uncharacterized protein
MPPKASNMFDIDKIIEKYYNKDSDLYITLMTHSTQVMNKALEIAEKKKELMLDTTFIAEAAMLHDIGIFKCYASRIHCVGSHHYIEHGYLGAEILRTEGMPRHALVCERHTGVGLSREMIAKGKLPLPDRDMLPQSLEEQLICYADKFYSKTKPGETHQVDAIRKELARFGQYQVMIFDKWHAFFE